MDYYLICCKGSLCAKHAATGNEPEEIIYFLAGLLTTELQNPTKTHINNIKMSATNYFGERKSSMDM